MLMQSEVTNHAYFVGMPTPDNEEYYLKLSAKQLVSLSKVSQETATEIVQMTIVHGGQIASPMEDYRTRCKGPQHWIFPDWYIDWIPLRTVPAMIQGKKEIYWALRESSHPRLKDDWYLIIAE